MFWRFHSGQFINLTHLSIHPAHLIWQIWSMAPIHQFIKIAQLIHFPNSPTLGYQIKVFRPVLEWLYFTLWFGVSVAIVCVHVVPVFLCFCFCFWLAVFYLFDSLFEFMQFEPETGCLLNWHSERRFRSNFKLYFLRLFLFPFGKFICQKFRSSSIRFWVEIHFRPNEAYSGTYQGKEPRFHIKEIKCRMNFKTVIMW